jgi:peptidoglycan/xylan/chitin deacetylase (PgdA/CDA1 family)
VSSARRRAAQPLVLAYHAVSDSWPDSLSVKPAALERQLSLLARRGYRGVTFGDAVSGAGEGKLVAITFDDAHRSVVTEAAPIMASLGMVGTMFVPTAYAGVEGPVAWRGIEHWLQGDYRGELVRASWAELRALSEAGWEIGSHSHTHPYLPELSDAELAFELAHSREVCESEMGLACRSLAYPYGAFDERVMAAAAASGYSAAASLPRRSLINRSHYAWPRIAVFRSDSPSRFRLKVNPATRSLRRSRILSLRSRLPHARR